MVAFLRLARWEGRCQMLDRTRAHLRQGSAPGLEEVLRTVIAKAEAAVQHPRIMDSVADVVEREGVVGSFEASVAAFQRLEAVRQGAPRYEFVFAHPSFIWIERDGAEAEIAQLDSAHWGKWITYVDSLEAATTVAERLLPAFTDGQLASAKFFVCTIPYGGLYFLVYASDTDFERKELLEAAARQGAFYVYDTDCYEAAALGYVLSGLTRYISQTDTTDLPAQRDVWCQRLNTPGYGEEIDLSDVQRRLILSVLHLCADTDPCDRFAFLAHSYFEGWPLTLTAHLPILFDERHRRSVSALLHADRLTRI